jgi:Excalibur calcium-binding domain
MWMAGSKTARPQRRWQRLLTSKIAIAVFALLVVCCGGSIAYGVTHPQPSQPSHDPSATTSSHSTPSRAISSQATVPGKPPPVSLTPKARPTTAGGSSKTTPHKTSPTTPSQRPSKNAPHQPAPSAPGPQPSKTSATPGPSAPYYANCADAWRAGAAPLHRGQPGYRRALDGDGNGVACEHPPRSKSPTQAPPAPVPTSQEQAPPEGPEPYYRNCSEAWKAGAAPLHRGEPGYRRGLDSDGDGIACEEPPH